MPPLPLSGDAKKWMLDQNRYVRILGLSDCSRFLMSDRKYIPGTVQQFCYCDEGRESSREFWLRRNEVSITQCSWLECTLISHHDTWRRLLCTNRRRNKLNRRRTKPNRRRTNKRYPMPPKSRFKNLRRRSRSRSRSVGASSPAGHRTSRLRLAGCSQNRTRGSNGLRRSVGASFSASRRKTRLSRPG